MPKPFDTTTSLKAKATSDIQRERYTRYFMEDDRWRDLAREAGVNLPVFYARPSDTEIRRWLKGLGIPWQTYVEAYGWETAEQFENLNPRHSMRPLAGIILELWDELRQAKRACVGAAEARDIKVGAAQPKKQRYPRGVAKARRVPLEQIDLGNDVK